MLTFDSNDRTPPRKGDQLFRSGLPDWHNNACLNVMHGGDLVAYKEGYLLGAHLLVQYVMEKARDQDFLVYPVVFLYRHHIELAMKRILRRALYVIGRGPRDAEQKHAGMHRLDLLWQDLKLVLEELHVEGGIDPLPAEDLAGIEDYIRQLSEVDPDSFSFRYTHSRKGIASLPKDLRLFNLRNFAEMMERLARYLDWVDAATDYAADMKSEMEVQRAQDMGDYYG